MKHRFWPDTLLSQLLILFVSGVILIAVMNLWLIHKLQDSYISQTLTDRVNISASRISLMNSWDNAKRREALANLAQYNDDSWSVGHVLLDKPPTIGFSENAQEKKFNDALRTRLAIKGISTSDKTSIHIFPEKPQSFREPYLQDALEKVDAGKFPVMEIGARLEDGSWLVIFQSMKFDFTELAHIQYIQLVAYTTVFCFLFYLVIRLVLRPLKKLSGTAESFGQNPELANPLKETGSRELRQAANALNVMRQRICDNIEQRNQMLASLAHDLRTPLARIQLRMEEIDDEALRRAFLKDCKEIEQLTKYGLELARSLYSDEKPVKLDLDSFIESIIEDYHETGLEITFSKNTDKNIYLVTRPICLRRCIVNLLDNSFRYGINPEIAIKEEHNSLYLEVIDFGPGIPANELKNVIKPFYQLDKSRNKKFGGTGLGLSIAYNMALLSFASLSLHPNAPTGLKATLVFSRS